MERRPSRATAGWRRTTSLLLTTGLASSILFLPHTAQGAGEEQRQPAGQAAAASRPSLPAARLEAVHASGTKPMIAAAVPLKKAGYAEHEFFADGRAHRYRGAVPDAQKTAAVIDSDWNYRTRVLVRTPKKKDFNGSLVVEWANVTAGQDIDFAFAESYEYLLRKGYAVAVVSAQNVGVERLKTWSPKRYGTLSVKADNVDPQGGGPIDVAAAGRPADPLSWDVMTEVSKALKKNAGPDKPLPGLKVRNVIALGESQSAGRLTTYYNTIQPIYGFFDGFVFLDRAGQLRSDLRTPAISVNSEALAGFQPAPAETTRYTRTWEVAGASHASLYGAHYVDSVVLRDKSLVGPSGPTSFTDVIASRGCELTPFFSTVDSGLVLNTALDATRRWILTGHTAAPSRFFTRDASGALVRNADDRIEGGIRIAQFTAPTAYLHPNQPGVDCQLSYHHKDYTAAQLKQRYGTHASYVAQVRLAMDQAVVDGYILRYDRKQAIKAAKASDVAR